MKTTFYMRHAGTIEGNALEAGAVVAEIETPDGLPLNRILNGIVSGLVTPNKPEPAAPAAPTAATPDAAAGKK